MAWAYFGENSKLDGHYTDVLRPPKGGKTMTWVHLQAVSPKMRDRFHHNSTVKTLFMGKLPRYVYWYQLRVVVRCLTNVERLCSRMP